MAKYSKKASEKVETVMHEMKKGKLRTGSGKKVTDPKQAIAIGLSEAKKEGAKVPEKESTDKKKTEPKPKASTSKKTSTEKSKPGPKAKPGPKPKK